MMNSCLEGRGTVSLLADVALVIEPNADAAAALRGRPAPHPIVVLLEVGDGREPLLLQPATRLAAGERVRTLRRLRRVRARGGDSLVTIAGSRGRTRVALDYSSPGRCARAGVRTRSRGQR